MKNHLYHYFIRIFQDDRKLIATDPRHHILAANGATQDLRRFHQQFIAFFVAPGIVDPLQPIDVDDGDRYRAASPVFQSMQFFLEIGPVVYAGQCIVKTDVGQALFGFPTSGYVKERHDHLLDLAPLVQVRKSVHLEPFLVHA